MAVSSQGAYHCTCIHELTKALHPSTHMQEQIHACWGTTALLQLCISPKAALQTQLTCLRVWLEQIVPVPQAQHGVTVTLQVVCAWQKAVAWGHQHA